MREELREEIGGVSDDIRQITAFYPSVSRTDQIAYVFTAFDVRLETGQRLERTERIEIRPTPAKEALAMARRGEIRDGQSALCLILCEGLLREMGFWTSARSIHSGGILVSDDAIFPVARDYHRAACRR